MYRLHLTPKAKRQLKSISEQHRQAVGGIFEMLKEEPTLGKPLERERVGQMSLRLGVYRVVYKINQQDETIVILDADHRSKVYQ